MLLTNDLVAIDCKSTGLLSYLNPYAMDFQVGHVAHKMYYLPAAGAGERGDVLQLPVRLPGGAAGRAGGRGPDQEGGRLGLERVSLAGQRGPAV